MFVTLEPHHLESAFKYWIGLCQEELCVNLEKAILGKGIYRKLNVVKRDDGIYIARGRVEQWNQMTYEHELPIIQSSHRFAKLFVIYMHKKGHL